MNLFKAICIGVSAGGFTALESVFSGIQTLKNTSILVVLHIPPDSNGYHLQCWQKSTKLKIVESMDKMPIEKGKVYVAPPDFHMVVKQNNSIELSKTEKVSFARPSIDVLFESASLAFGANMIGIIMTGANSDGVRGLNWVKKRQGITVVQDPKSATSSFLPMQAINQCEVDYILSPDEIAKFILKIDNIKGESVA